MSDAGPILAISSFSLREQLGPIVFRFRDASGGEQSFTLDSPKLFDISDFPRRAKQRLACDWVETTAFQFAGLDDPELDRFAAGLRASDVHLLNVALDTGDLADPDPVRRAADIAELKEWIERFAAMGSTFVRVNPGSPMSHNHGEVPPDHLVAALQELGSFAGDLGTRLLVENHGGRSSDHHWLLALLDAVGSDLCGLLLDLGNFDALLGPLRKRFEARSTVDESEFAEFSDGLDLEPLYAAVDALAPRAEHVSVKIHHVTSNETCGPVDLTRALGLLAHHGYDGPFAIEYEGTSGDPWAKSLVVLDATRALVGNLTGGA